MSLSEPLTVTLSLEGPAPLRIEPPPGWLSEESAADWKAGASEPARVEPLAGGNERWSITFRVDPYVVGTAVPLQFAPVRVTAGSRVASETVDWPGLEVRLVTSLTDPKPTDARPITGIEEPPAPACR